LGCWRFGIFWCFFQLAHAVDNIGSARLAGLLVAILVILSFFVLMRLVYTKVSVEMEHSAIRFQKKGHETITIPLSEIDKMIINAKRMNTLHLNDKSGGLLWAILLIANTKDLIIEIPQMIAGKEDFKIATTNKKFFGTDYTTTSYQRMS